MVLLGRLGGGMKLVAGTVIAERFRLDRELGEGGMGAVWLAHHLALHIPCAVKFIHAEAAASAQIRQRFEREAQSAAQIRSPHVVQILDHGVFDGTPYIAMELLEGEDLASRLRRVGRLAPRATVAIASQVARALTKAHAAGLVHRDLKPANIFLVRDDDHDLAKVLDFGVAKSNAADTGGGSTKTGSLLGTPYYMSPEQARGTKAVDHRSDLWALAVIVYQCSTGTLPFASEALGDLLIKIVTEPIPVPSEAAPDLPASFDAWWSRATKRDPDKRYQSAKELVDALAAAFGLGAPGELASSNAGPTTGSAAAPVAPGGTVVMLPAEPGGSLPGAPPLAGSAASPASHTPSPDPQPADSAPGLDPPPATIAPTPTHPGVSTPSIADKPGPRRPAMWPRVAGAVGILAAGALVFGLAFRHSSPRPPGDERERARRLLDDAQGRWQAGDGTGCIADLDQHDQLDPRPEYLSTAPMMASLRGTCLMLAGQCPAGRALYRAYVDSLHRFDADVVDATVERTVATYCQGGPMSPREEYLKATGDLRNGAYMKKIEPEQCKAILATLRRLVPIVEPDLSANKLDRVSPRLQREEIAGCLARAGDCAGAWEAWQQEIDLAPPAERPPRPDVGRAQFDAATENKCKAPASGPAPIAPSAAGTAPAPPAPPSAPAGAPKGKGLAPGGHPSAAPEMKRPAQGMPGVTSPDGL
jgi:serine/threonine protein kinase